MHKCLLFYRTWSLKDVAHNAHTTTPEIRIFTTTPRGTIAESAQTLALVPPPANKKGVAHAAVYEMSASPVLEVACVAVRRLQANTDYRAKDYSVLVHLQ